MRLDKPFMTKEQAKQIIDHISDTHYYVDYQKCHACERRKIVAGFFPFQKTAYSLFPLCIRPTCYQHAYRHTPLAMLSLGLVKCDWCHKKMRPLSVSVELPGLGEDCNKGRKSVHLSCCVKKA